MDNDNLTSKNKSNSSFAAIGGGGGGTLLLTLAQSLPDDNKLKPLLVLIAPAFSVALNYFWLFVSSELIKWRKERVIQKKINNTREELISKINDPKIPEETKKKHQEQLNILEDKAFQHTLEIIST